MTFRNPSYITKSKHGVYYFQARIPRFYANKLGIRSLLFRRSLRTKNKRLALSIASRIWSRFYLFVYLNEPLSKKGKGHQQLEELFQGDAHILAEDFKLTQNATIAIEVFDRFDEISPQNTYLQEMFWDSLEVYELDAVKFIQDNEIDLDKYRTLPKSALTTTITAESKTLKDLRVLEFDELLSSYLAFRKTNKVVKKSLDLYKDQITLFRDLTKVKNSGEITEDTVEQFANLLPKVPSRRKIKAAYRNRTLDELINAQIPDDDYLSESTISTYATNVKSFLDWCVKRRHCIQGATVSLEGAFKKASSYPFLPFTDDDIRLLFINDRYLKGKHTQQSHYWIPLIAMFTGARQNEICQLSCNDVKEYSLKSGTQIYYFDFNDEDFKSLKNQNSKRAVPMHSELVKLGFLEFVKRRKQKGSDRIFDDLKEKGGKFNADFSKWFGRYRVECGVISIPPDKRKVFHSFRHTLATQLRNHSSDIPIENISEVIGHSHKGTTLRVYAKDLSMEKKHEIIKKIKFDVDFKTLRRWIKT